MNWILKNWPAALLLCAGIVACIATFVSSKQDQDQKDAIQKLGQENLALSKEISKLDSINNNIASRVEQLSDENNKLIGENINLSKETKALISEVQNLTEKSKQLIDKIDKTTTYSAEENLQTGELTIGLDSKLSDNDNINVLFGQNITVAPIKKLKEGKGLPFSLGSMLAIFLKIDNNNKFLFNIQVFDIEENLIAEIINNNWRSNKNYVSKFNYDESGFEVMDNKGRIVLNIDLISNNTILIQGIWLNQEKQICLIGSKGFVLIPAKTPEYEAALKAKQNKDYNTYIKESINKVQIKQLFEYTGKHWLHRRIK